MPNVTSLDLFQKCHEITVNQNKQNFSCQFKAVRFPEFKQEIDRLSLSKQTPQLNISSNIQCHALVDKMYLHKTNEEICDKRVERSLTTAVSHVMMINRWSGIL